MLGHNVCTSEQIKVTPTELHFVAAKWGNAASPRFLHVVTDDLKVPWSVEEDLDWLYVDRPQGEGPTIGRPVGVHVGHMHFIKPKTGLFRGTIKVHLHGANRRTVEIPVTMNVINLDRVEDVSNRRQLFIDNRFIAGGKNYELRMNPAQKMGPVIERKEGMRTGHVLSVFTDDGRYKMYYGVYAQQRSIAYAESTDGLHWTRPNLGLVDEGGNKQNNLIYRERENKPEIANVFLDPWDISSRRYKMFICTWHHPEDMSVDGMYAYYSADGLRFTRAGRVLPLCIDNPTIVQWDENIGRYVIFARAFIPSTENQRRIARIVTDDLLKPWPYKPASEYIRPTPDNLDVVLKADDDIDRYCDLYYNNGIVYPWAQDAYFMFITPFRHFYPDSQPFVPRKAPGQWEDFGLIETQLAVSRNGINWHRPERWPYFPLGLVNEWDRWTTITGSGMIRHGNYIYQYYSSSGRTHDSNFVRPEYADLIPLENKIGMVRQRLDGFMSVNVDHRGGWIETPSLVFRGDQLRLNIDTGATGTTFVEIRDWEGNPIPGFTLEDCEETGSNYLDVPVHWKGNTDVSSLAGKPVRLYFKMNLTKLYSFRFVDTKNSAMQPD